MTEPRAPLAGGASPSRLTARVESARERLSNRRQRFLHGVLSSPDETYFLSSRQLAARFGVDPATVSRTIQTLGYSGFAEFAADLRDHFLQHVTPYTVMRSAAGTRRTVADQVRHSLEQDHANLAAVAASVDPQQVEALAEQVLRARRVLVVGLDLAHAVAHFLAYGLTVLGIEAEAPPAGGGGLQYKVRCLGPEDLLLAISFRRCLRETVEAVEDAAARGVPTFALTDAATTPLARKAGGFLAGTIAGPSFAGSYAVPISLANALLVACAHRQPGRSLEALRKTQEDYETGPRWYRERRG